MTKLAFLVIRLHEPILYMGQIKNRQKPNLLYDMYLLIAVLITFQHFQQTEGHQ